MIEHEVSDVVRERTPNEELHRHVINTFGISAAVGLVGKHPALGKNVADRSCQGFVMFTSVGCGGVHIVVLEEVTCIDSAQSLCRLGRWDSILRGQAGCCRGVKWFRDDWSSAHKKSSIPTAFERVEI